MCMVLEKRLKKSCKSAHFAKITSNKLKIKNTWESLPVLTPLIAPRQLSGPALALQGHEFPGPAGPGLVGLAKSRGPAGPGLGRARGKSRPYGQGPGLALGYSRRYS